MKSPIPNKRLAEILRKAIRLNALGASYLEISVQPDRIVAQLSFNTLPSPFGDMQVLSIVDGLRIQIENITTTEPEFFQLDYAVSDSSRLWVFMSENYGMGSMPVCNCQNNQIEWSVPIDLLR